jgi:hypothetical protein
MTANPYSAPIEQVDPPSRRRQRWFYLDVVSLLFAASPLLFLVGWMVYSRFITLSDDPADALVIGLVITLFITLCLSFVSFVYGIIRLFYKSRVTIATIAASSASVLCWGILYILFA